jgi:FtsP/CotA-like multicopper oxidase with cupredoxin domain/plastocyanin
VTMTNPERDPIFRGLMVAMAVAVLIALVFDGLSKRQTTTVSAESARSAPTLVAVTLEDFSIAPATMKAAAGVPITLSVTNKGQSAHEVAVDVNGTTMQTPMLQAGGGGSLSLPALQAGSYKVWCTVPGHEALGMTASLVVGSGSAATDSSSMAGMAGMGSMDHMTPQQMAQGHKQSMTAFPAKTAGVGNQVLKPTMAGGVKVFDLTSSEFRWQTAPGQFVQAFGYNQQVPGPQIRVHQGDTIRVVLHNRLTQPTTIHWHGVTVPNKDDGVPYVTQDPVMPGQTFTYEFKVVDRPGTYLYHSHFNSNEQVSRGLYGTFVVEPTKPTWNEEYSEVLNDGPLGYTIDGKQWPGTAPLVAKLGDTVLVRLANVGTLLHPLHLHGYHFTVIAQDGAPVAKPYEADTVVVAPGETFDVLVHTIYPGVWAFHCHILSHVEGPQGMFGMATALVVK